MIKQILLRAQKNLWVTYVLLVVEFIFAAILPWLLGKAIDSGLKHHHEMLGVYVACAFVGLVVGFTRRRFDTRVFSKICSELSIQTMTSLFDRKVPVSKITARTNNVKKFTDFFEHFVPQFVRSVIYIITAFCILYSTMGLWSFVILFIMFGSLGASFVFANKIEKVIHEDQKTNEIREHFILEKQPSRVELCYIVLQKLLVKRSDLEAMNWGVVDVCCIACELIAIIILINSVSTAGEITSTLMYVNSLCGYFSSFSYSFMYMKELKVAKEFIEKD